MTKRSVSGWSAKLNNVSYTRKSKMQRFVTLSVTEADCVAAISCVRDMIYGKHFIESLGLKVKLPMTLYMDNKGGVDIFNNWTIAGNTRAVSVRFCYIRAPSRFLVNKSELLFPPLFHFISNTPFSFNTLM